MNEQLLQYIWQFQYFNAGLLQTTEGKDLQVIKPGTHNTNQGPDFINAKIKIDNTLWAGSIELHINTSDWKLHNHSNDKNYSNVILHVVWNADIELILPFPTLELKNRIPKLLLKKYNELMQETHFIPCQNLINRVSTLTMISWKERLMIERLQNRSVHIESLLKQNNQHWEEVFWRMLSRNFGSIINSEAFEKMASSIPFNVLAKHKHQIHQLEALLQGQAGLLDRVFKDDYPQMLQKEHRFLQMKYKLEKIHAPIYFLRMRPANFPTIRLSQLAALVHQSRHLFSSVKEITHFKNVEELFSVTANDYWHYHYVFDEAATFKKKTTGKQMIRNIMINTVVPVLYAYGYFNNIEMYKIKALKWMGQASAEKNSITKGFEMLGLVNKNAYDSQALIQLKKEYCDQKQCLQCAIGNKILKET